MGDGTKIDLVFLALQRFNRRQFDECIAMCSELLANNPYDQVCAGPSHMAGAAADAHADPWRAFLRRRCGTSSAAPSPWSTGLYRFFTRYKTGISTHICERLWDWVSVDLDRRHLRAFFILVPILNPSYLVYPVDVFSHGIMFKNNVQVET